jgi:hypothetical protein
VSERNRSKRAVAKGIRPAPLRGLSRSFGVSVGSAAGKGTRLELAVRTVEALLGIG